MHQHSLNIGLIAFAWRPSDEGGLMTHVRGIAESLTALGHKIFIHCADTTSTSTAFATKSLLKGGVHIQEMSYRYEDAKFLPLYDFSYATKTHPQSLILNAAKNNPNKCFGQVVITRK